MKFVVSGLAGCGASTLTLLLAKSLNLKLYKGSESFRYLASSLGAKDNHEETHLIEASVQPFWGPVYDKYIAEVLSSEVYSDLIVDSDIAGFMVGKHADLVRIFLHADMETRIKHFSTDSRPAEESQITSIDKKLEREYMKLHQIEFLNLEYVAASYEIVMDNSNLKISEELDFIYSYLSKEGLISSEQASTLTHNSSKEDEEFWQNGKSALSAYLKNNNQVKSGIEIIQEAKALFADDIASFPQELLEVINNT